MKKIIILAGVLAAMILPSQGQEHMYPSHGGDSSDRNANTRVPQIVQSREISRVPIRVWVAASGHEYVDETHPNQAPQGHWETQGYTVTYLDVYDNGTSQRRVETE